MHRAVTAANTTVFVKFPCIVGAPGLDASGACKKGMPPKYEATPDQHLKSIQAVSDMCGFSFLKSRTWSAPVHARTPEVRAQHDPHTCGGGSNAVSRLLVGVWAPGAYAQMDCVDAAVFRCGLSHSWAIAHVSVLPSLDLSGLAAG